MQVTLTKAEHFEPLQQAWKEMGAPCHLRKTNDPLKATICLNKGVDPVFANLFIIEQSGLDERERERLKKSVYKSFFKSTINKYEEELEKFRQ